MDADVQTADYADLDALVGSLNIGQTVETMVDQPPTATESPESHDPAATSIEATGDVAAPTSDPETQPVQSSATALPNWESDDNPFRSRAQKAETFLAKLHQMSQRNREAAEEAAADELIERLPDLPPEQQRMVVSNLRMWERQRADARVAALQAETEPHLKEFAIDRKARELGLTDEDRAELARWDDPRVMETIANERKMTREKIAAVESSYQAQLDELRKNQAAIERRTTGVDRVAGQDMGTPADPESIDDLVASLNLGSWMR